MNGTTHPVFPGYGYYLEVAARESGLYDAVAPARANRVLANLGNLCGQASAHDDPERLAEILRGVEALASQLELASRAGARMVSELRSRLTDSAEPSPESCNADAVGAEPFRQEKPRSARRSPRSRSHA
jgi:hypothetical protein